MTLVHFANTLSCLKNAKVCYGKNLNFLSMPASLLQFLAFNGKSFSSSLHIWYILIYFAGYTLCMTNGSTGEKVKEKTAGTKDKVKEKVMGTKDKVKETMGMGGGGKGAKRKEGELGPGAASKVEEEVAKTSSDSPTKRVEGPGKALGKEEGSK
jgi:hypothetical protein